MFAHTFPNRVFTVCTSVRGVHVCFCACMCVRLCLCDCMAAIQSCVPSATSAGGATQGWCCWCIITPFFITCPTLLLHNTMTNEPIGCTFSCESLGVGICVSEGVCECPRIWLCAVCCMFEVLIHHFACHYLLFIPTQVMTSKCHKCCVIGGVLFSIVCLCLHQAEQLEVLLAIVPFYLQNYVKTNPPQGAIIYNGWLHCHYHLALRAQVPHLIWRSMVDSVCALSVKPWTSWPGCALWSD